jgi:hypothetical protein
MLHLLKTFMFLLWKYNWLVWKTNAYFIKKFFKYIMPPESVTRYNLRHGPVACTLFLMQPHHKTHLVKMMLPSKSNQWVVLKLFKTKNAKKHRIEILFGHPPLSHPSLNLHNIWGWWGSHGVVYIEPPLFKVQAPIVSGSECFKYQSITRHTWQKNSVYFFWAWEGLNSVAKIIKIFL